MVKVEHAIDAVCVQTALRCSNIIDGFGRVPCTMYEGHQGALRYIFEDICQQCTTCVCLYQHS